MIKKVYILLIVLLSISSIGVSQTIIGIQDFEFSPATPTMTFSGGSIATGNGAFPNAPKFVSGSRGRQVNNSTTNITYATVNAAAYTNIFFSCRLASFAGSSGNGADGTDYVIVSISNDGGATWSQELKVNGASSANAKWSFTSGTGTASSVYDGNNATINFSPAGSGDRTTDGYSTITVTNLPSSANLRVRLEMKNNSGNEYWIVDDAIIKGTLSVPCVADSEPTVNSTSLAFPDTTCNSIDLSWTTGNGANTIVVASTTPITGTPTDQTAYTANSIFGSGVTIAAGEFVIFNGNGTTTTVTGLAASTTYYFAIFEYNGTTANCEENYLTSSFLTENFNTPICPVSTDPEITGILVNACGGNEGLDEFVTFTNGNTALDIDSISLDFPVNGPYCNSGCGGLTIVTNPTFVAQLNTTAGCPVLILEADPIPAGGTVIVFTGASPTYSFDFSNLCGTGPYYAIFANNTVTDGRFSNFNGDCATRTMIIDFGTTSSDTATYSRCLTTNTDGDYVQFAADGTPTYQNDGTCTPTAILPITLLNFDGKKQQNGTNLLEWTTSSEINNDYFTLEKSADAINFTAIGTVLGAGNSNTPLSYYFIDDSPFNGINYYRLKQTDFNGAFEYFNIIALNNETNNANIFVANNKLQINLDTEVSNGTIEIYDVVGKIVYTESITSNKRINTANFNVGIYIVKITTPTNIIVKKIKF